MFVNALGRTKVRWTLGRTRSIELRRVRHYQVRRKLRKKSLQFPTTLNDNQLHVPSVHKRHQVRQYIRAQRRFNEGDTDI